jgi:transcriptional regulator
MTQKQQIMVLVQQGLDNGEIARRLGCRREYVRVAKRRAELARVEKSERAEPKAVTLQAKIVTLVEQGLGDVDIAQRVGCRREYVRVVRRRAGLLRQAAPRRTSLKLAEATLQSRIAKLEARLADAQQKLQKIRDRQKYEAMSQSS